MKFDENVDGAKYPFLSASLVGKRNLKSLDLGVDADTFEILVNKIYIGMCSPDMQHQKGMRVVDVAKLIEYKVNSMVSAVQMQLTKQGKSWVIAEGVGAWVRIHAKDWTELRNPGMVKEEYINSTFMLNMLTPKGVCSGFSVMTRDISRALGLQCYNVIGVSRDFGRNTSQRDNHEWNCFVFPGDIHVPMDTSQTRLSAETVIERSGKIYHEWVLPKTIPELELFLSAKYGRKSRDVINTTEIELNGMSFEKWSVTPTGFEDALRNEYRKQETIFNRANRRYIF